MANLQTFFRRATVTRSNKRLGVDTPAEAGEHGHDGHGELGHVMPIPVLLAVFGALLVFTVLTVAVTKVQLGELNIYIALGIALVKAALVLLYFMHLRYDNPFNGLAIVASLLFVALFIAVTITDSRQYAPQLKANNPNPPALPAR
jgi:cytochrome c oxidase subunit 4